MRALLLLCASCSFKPGVYGRHDADVSVGDDATDALMMTDDAPMDGMTDAPPDAPPDAPKCVGFADIANGPAGSVYRIHPYSANGTADESKFWSQAKPQCETEGGYLAILDNQAELSALDAAIPQNPSVVSNAFLVGITDAATEGTWLTVFGQPATYLPWGTNPQQPNGGTVQNCGAANNGGLSDIVCGTAEADHKLAFACECNP